MSNSPNSNKKKLQKKFPKKAKLIADGGFFKIIPIKEFLPKINMMTLRRIGLNFPEISYEDTWKFELQFHFERVYKGYAEYRQYDAVRVLSKD